MKVVNGDDSSFKFLSSVCSQSLDLPTQSDILVLVGDDDHFFEWCEWYYFVFRIFVVLASIWSVSASCLSPTCFGSISSCGYLWPGMHSPGQRARVLQWCVDAASPPPLQLHRQTSQIIIAPPRSRRSSATLNHSQRDEREMRMVCWSDGMGGSSVCVCVCL